MTAGPGLTVIRFTKDRMKVLVSVHSLVRRNSLMSLASVPALSRSTRRESQRRPRFLGGEC